MFESSVVESRKIPLKKNRLVVLPLSIALHAGALAGLLFAGVWSVSLPGNAPPQIAAFVLRVPAPALPAGGGPKAKPSLPQQPAHPRPAAVPPDTPQPDPAPADLTPSQIPDTIPDLQPGTGGWPSDGSDGVVDFGGDGSDTGTGTGTGSGPGPAIDEQPVPVGGAVSAPRVVSRVDPRYPDLLIRTKLRGKAVVECVVDRHGIVESVRTITATHPLFAESAIDAVKQWRFEPGRLNGRSVKTVFTLSVNFEVKR